ncbi:MAG: tRNA (adenosine(37)-N6)-threonylcarbamoyltransferase complex ATPase subunit type 1 TsaE [Bacteroidetes bacterium]|nr:tRNA (adenosine(37)-N6)-threonylcarbamoyltransferase complex ATPase subunit type 1 TsaE [Bacteroidota bacterium]
MVVEFSLDKIKEAAEAFVAAIENRKVIAFHGEMGAGKTTFITALCHALGVTNAVSSPTFSIINEYRSAGGERIYHMDLYRLKDETEAMNAGVEDAIYSGDLCLVEWPEKAPGIFPPDTVHCYLQSVAGNQRKLQINL